MTFRRNGDSEKNVSLNSRKLGAINLSIILMRPNYACGLNLPSGLSDIGLYFLARLLRLLSNPGIFMHIALFGANKLKQKTGKFVKLLPSTPSHLRTQIYYFFNSSSLFILKIHMLIGSNFSFVNFIKKVFVAFAFTCPETSKNPFKLQVRLLVSHREMRALFMISIMIA